MLGARLDRGEARECVPDALTCQRAHSVGAARACALMRVEAQATRPALDPAGPGGLGVSARGGASGRVRCVRRVIARLRCRRR